MKIHSNSNNPFIKTLLVLAILTGCVNGLLAVSFPTDTLIIDGKKVSVEVQEGEEEQVLEEKDLHDSLASNLFRTKFLNFGHNRGFSFNSLSSNGTDPVLEEFIGSQANRGTFSNLEVSFLAETQKNVWLGASLGIANWEINHISYTDGVDSKFFKFESIESNTLNRIDTTVTGVGIEFDTIRVNLGTEKYFASHFNLGLQLGTELFKKKSSEKNRFIGLVGVNLQTIRNYTLDDFHFLNEETWFTVNAEDLEKNKIEISASLKLMMIHELNSRLYVSPSILFTEHFMPAFVDFSGINYSRRGVGLGLSLNWNL